jgi:hypothetical protein
MTATRNPKAAVASWSSWPARRAGAAASRAPCQAGRRAALRSGPGPCRAALTAPRHGRSPRRRRRAGARPRTAAAGASTGTSGTGRGGAAASPAARRSAEPSVPVRAPTGAAARLGTTGRPARRTSALRTRPPRRRTAASARSFPSRSPAHAIGGGSYCTLPGRRPSRNRDRRSPAEATPRVPGTGDLARLTCAGTGHAHGVVAHETTTEPPRPAQHAHGERRKQATRRSERMSPNTFSRRQSQPPGTLNESGHGISRPGWPVDAARPGQVAPVTAGACPGGRRSHPLGQAGP